MKHLNKHKIILPIIVLALMFSTTGCFQSYSKDTIVMVTQFFYAVPGAESATRHTTQCEFLDTDDYGRQLFAMSINEYSGMAGVCILQKSDNKYVYYYDNISYQCTETFKSYTQEQLDDLKEANDWNKPINVDKMVKKPYVNTSTLWPRRNSSIDLKKAESAFYNTISEDENISTFVRYFDFSQDGQEIFFVSRHKEDIIDNANIRTNVDNYLMILNSDGSYDPENYLVKLEDAKNSNAQLAEIKEKNGWVG